MINLEKSNKFTLGELEKIEKNFGWVTLERNMECSMCPLEGKCPYKDTHVVYGCIEAIHSAQDRKRHYKVTINNSTHPENFYFTDENFDDFILWIYSNNEDFKQIYSNYCNTLSIDISPLSKKSFISCVLHSLDNKESDYYYNLDWKFRSYQNMEID